VDKSLVFKHEPILVFSQDEHFFPMPIQEYVQRCSLHTLEAKGTTMIVPPGHLSFEELQREGLWEKLNTDDHFLAYITLGTPQEIEQALHRLLEEPSTLRSMAAVAPVSAEAARLPFESAVKVVVRVLAEADVKFRREFWQSVLDLTEPLGRSQAVEERARQQYGENDAERPPYSYYYRVTQDKGYDVIQYWYFYAYNSQLNDHEGDWESVTLYLKDGQPLYAAYSAHAGRALHAWNTLNFQDGHPLVYIALGSHANYSKPGAVQLPDVFFAESKRIGQHAGATPWASEEIDQQLWLSFQGHWGTCLARPWYRRLLDYITLHLLREKLPYVNDGPLGPSQGRTAWNSPVAYAGLK
jgi:hypothetical protein